MIKINGNIIGGNTSGRNISIINGKVIVDGQTVEINDKAINIEITGNVDLLCVDACEQVTVNGDVKTVKTMSGDVEVSGAVEGSISTMSGAVRAGSIGGNASSMSGSITIK